MSRLDNDEWDAEGWEAKWRRDEYRCRRCGQFRLGVDVSWINDIPYCNGTCDVSPTCYTQEGGI